MKKELLPAGLVVHNKLLNGRAYKTIIEEADEHDYDLIVISTRGLTRLSSHIIGSNAERVVRFVRCPVLSIEGKVFPEKFTIRNILLPTDFSECSFAALRYAFSIARAYRAKIYWLYAAQLENEPLKLPMSHFPDPKKYDDHAADVEYEMVVDKDIEPSNSIIRFEQNYDIDLIVMGTHGKKGIRRVFIGNNTAEVVRQALCPVLTVTHPMHKIVFTRSATQEIHKEKDR
jgi:nucleotide-binding universal stress UspA family protein